MQVQVRVTPRTKHRIVQKVPDGTLLVKVTEPAEGGRANAAVIKALAEHFGVPERLVTIVRGLASRRKWVEIMNKL